MQRAPRGVTKPQAGVMATSPATAPVMAPTAVGFPFREDSRIIHPSIAAPAAMLVVTNATVATVPDASALPALKPNQPNQSIPAPSMTRVTLWGGVTRCGKFRRGPSIRVATSAATPALTCTTVPPAKSRAPRACSQPLAPQTQWAIRSYEMVDQSATNSANERNRNRSTTAPEMSAGVIIANIP